MEKFQVWRKKNKLLLTRAVQFQSKFEIGIETVGVRHVCVHLEGRQHSQIHAPLAQLLNGSLVGISHGLVHIASV